VFDVAIIGAGPGGSTLARLIGGRYRVLLVDKRPLLERPDSRRSGKCCGGLLAPDAQGMLSRLGLGLPKSVLEEPQLFVVKAVDVQRGLERYYQRHYINMNRRKFDCWLLSMVPPGVEVRTGCRLQSWDRGHEGFRLVLAGDHGAFVEQARVLVGADGAFSKVRLQASGGPDMPRRYVAIQEWIETEGDPACFSSIFDRTITDFYCWTIPKDGRLIIGAALDPKDDASAKFALLKQRLVRQGLEIGRIVRREGAWLLRPVRTRQLWTGGDGLALIGEAGGWISPSSAEGLSYAFRTAVMLADSLEDGLVGFEKRYRERAGALKRNVFLKNVKARFIYDPTLRWGLMKSGLNVLAPVRGLYRSF